MIVLRRISKQLLFFSGCIFTTFIVDHGQHSVQAFTPIPCFGIQSISFAHPILIPLVPITTEITGFRLNANTFTKLHSSIRRPGPIRRKQQQRQPFGDEERNDSEYGEDVGGEKIQSYYPNAEIVESDKLLQGSHQSTTATTNIFQTTTASVSTLESSSSSLLYSLDPYSEEAVELLRNGLKLKAKQIEQIQELCSVLLFWNERINLVSRKDCTIETIFGRHVLPSLAPIIDPYLRTKFLKANSCIDVGTGGGFPGLPLAIAFPDTQFVLLDSVNKKLLAIDDMTKSLGITNVKTYNGRSEEYKPPNDKLFTIVTGRSVSAVPQFCSWVSHLLQPNDGQLIYWIGGKLDQATLHCLTYREDIQRIFKMINNTYTASEITSDKQIFVMPTMQVQALAADFIQSSIVTTTNAGSQNSRQLDRTRPSGWSDNNKPMRRQRLTSGGRDAIQRTDRQDGPQDSFVDQKSDFRTRDRTKLAKGEWRKKKSDDPKNGFRNSGAGTSTSSTSNFRRYKSTSVSTSRVSEPKSGNDD
jgi:16S rRNA (guanine527-N7)-methyltransferase